MFSSKKKQKYLLVKDLINDDWEIASHGYTICKCIGIKMDKHETTFPNFSRVLTLKENNTYIKSCLLCAKTIDLGSLGSLAIEFILCKKGENRYVRFHCRMICGECRDCTLFPIMMLLSYASYFTNDVHGIFDKNEGYTDKLYKHESFRNFCVCCYNVIKKDDVNLHAEIAIKFEEDQNIMITKNFCSKECQLIYENIEQLEKNNHNRELKMIFTLLRNVPLHKILPDTMWGNCHQCLEKIKEYKICSKCHNVVYCEKKCQKLDWENHKKWCADIPFQWSELQFFWIT